MCNSRMQHPCLRGDMGHGASMQPHVQGTCRLTCQSDCVQATFGPQLIGHLWSMAQQNELPFAAVQRALPAVAFADIFTGACLMQCILS